MDSAAREISPAVAAHAGPPGHASPPTAMAPPVSTSRRRKEASCADLSVCFGMATLSASIAHMAGRLFEALIHRPGILERLQHTGLLGGRVPVGIAAGG